MAYRRLTYQFRADGSQFRQEARAMDQATQQIGISAGHVATSFVAITATITAAAVALDRMLDQAHELDRLAVERQSLAQLVGGDRAAALTVEGFRETTGVGVEQYFDVAEAFGDALNNRTGEGRASAQRAAETIGLDVGAFRDDETPLFEQVNMVLDAILAFEGPEHELAQAASELGAGDMRDMLRIAGVVRDNPEFHPRTVRSFLAESGAVLTDEEAAAAGGDYLARTFAEIAGEEIATREDPVGFMSGLRLAASGLGLQEHLDAYRGERLLYDQRTITESEARAELGDEWYDRFGGVGETYIPRDAGWLAAFDSGHPDRIRIVADPTPEVRIVIEDSTTGGIKAAQRVTDGQSDGRTVGESDERPPAQ